MNLLGMELQDRVPQEIKDLADLSKWILSEEFGHMEIHNPEVLRRMEVASKLSVAYDVFLQAYSMAERGEVHNLYHTNDDPYGTINSLEVLAGSAMDIAFEYFNADNQSKIRGAIDTAFQIIKKTISTDGVRSNLQKAYDYAQRGDRHSEENAFKDAYNCAEIGDQDTNQVLLRDAEPLSYRWALRSIVGYNLSMAMAYRGSAISESKKKLHASASTYSEKAKSALDEADRLANDLGFLERISYEGKALPVRLSLHSNK